MRGQSIFLFVVAAVLASSVANEEATAFEQDQEESVLFDDYELLPEPEALTSSDEGDSLEGLVDIDDGTRIVAEKLIQELDEISSKLDDDETIGTSRAISSVDVNALDRLLKSAGLSSESPLFKNLKSVPHNSNKAMAQPNVAEIGGLGGLASGMSALGSLGGLLNPSMTKKNVEEIKAELKEMLFGHEEPKGRPIQRTRPKGTNRRQLFNRRPNQQREQLREKQRERPSGPVDQQREQLREKQRERPSGPVNNGGRGRRPSLFSFGSNKKPSPALSGASNLNQGGRRPVAEVREPDSDFQLPDPPFRAQFNPNANPSFTNFNQQEQQQQPSPQRPLRTNNGGRIPPPAQRNPQAQRPFNPSTQDRPIGSIATPPASEDAFRPVLLSSSNRVVQKQQPPVAARPTATPATVPKPLPKSPPTQFSRPATDPIRFPSVPPFQAPPQQAARQPVPPATQQVVPPAQSFKPPPGQRNPPVLRPQPPPPAVARPAPSVLPPGRVPDFESSGLLTSLFDAGPETTKSKPPKSNFVPDCELFSEGICLQVRNYPLEALASLLTRNRPVLDTMLAEVRSQNADDLTDGVSAAEERQYTYSHYYGNRKQGEDTHAHRDFAEEGGFLCPSEVKYARPQLAQTSRGNWKYIINMGEHTQTLRMEKCLKPKSGCSYVSPHYKSHCVQVYNYHRLLSWDDKKGMHIDIYKIPVGCSCHMLGYAYLYPPLDGKTGGGHILPPPIRTVTSFNNSVETRRETSTEGRLLPATTIPRSSSFGDRVPSSVTKTSKVSVSGSGASGILSREQVDDTEKTSAELDDFQEFMNRERTFFRTPARNKNTANERMDESSDDYSDPEETSKAVQSKTNYEYHPIIEFFQDSHLKA